MRNKRLLILVTGILAMFNANSQPAYPCTNAIFSKSVHTVLLHRQGFELSAPVLILGSSEPLLLSFDDLSQDLERYSYTIIHCTPQWEPTSGLLTQEFIDGADEEEVRDFQYSFNTTIPYIHYTATIPGRDLRPRISGNYLLVVYTDDPARPAFTRRFMVAEETGVKIECSVVQPSKQEDHETRQQVNLKVTVSGMYLSDPSREVQPVVLQNDRWDNALYFGKPRFVRGDELDYSFDDNMVFDGGNEFRHLDLKSLQYQTDRLKKLEFDTVWEATMLDDSPRATKNYAFEEDINGRMLVKNEDNVQNSAIESDYVKVRFTLVPDMTLPGTDIYLMGALTGWQMSPADKMRYNPFTKKFELTLLLKQGYYNYQYMMKDPARGYASAAFIEGNHWETENQYTVLVYLKEFSSQYSRLIGVLDLNTLGQ